MIDRDTRLRHSLFIFLKIMNQETDLRSMNLYLELYQYSSVNLLELLAFFLHMTLSLFLSLQYSDVINRSFEDRTFILADISHYLVILLVLFWQESSQLLYPVIYIEPSSSLN